MMFCDQCHQMRIAGWCRSHSKAMHGEQPSDWVEDDDGNNPRCESFEQYRYEPKVKEQDTETLPIKFEGIDMNEVYLGDYMLSEPEEYCPEQVGEEDDDEQ